MTQLHVILFASWLRDSVLARRCHKTWLRVRVHVSRTLGRVSVGERGLRPRIDTLPLTSRLGCRQHLRMLVGIHVMPLRSTPCRRANAKLLRQFAPNFSRITACKPHLDFGLHHTVIQLTYMAVNTSFRAHQYYTVKPHSEADRGSGRRLQEKFVVEHRSEIRIRSTIKSK